MKAANLWGNVTIVITSDFGRTLTANSKGGSDHGWGGHYFVAGGDVKGGRILGQFPSDMTTNGPVNIGRGRILPTMAWEKVWNGVCEWAGIETKADLNYCLPNRDKATANNPFRKDDIFEDK